MVFLHIEFNRCGNRGDKKIIFTVYPMNKSCNQGIDRV